VGDDPRGGHADNDRLIGNAGLDSMAGGAGDDWFDANDLESDTIDGNTGTDSIGTRYDVGVDVLIGLEA
jgi:Ca2+-binding RTX toxin-like protein